MSLSPEQKKAVSDWVAAGDNLSTVQKKLTEQFKISMTYRDVRFLVDDLGLELKSAAPKADVSDITRAPFAGRTSAAPGLSPESAPPEKAGIPADELTDDAVPEGEALPDEEFPEDAGVPADAPAGASTLKLKLEVDRIMRPGSVVSGTVTFSDGVSGKWALDQYGRLMLDTGQKGYQPSAADVKTFQSELQTQLARQGY